MPVFCFTLLSKIFLPGTTYPPSGNEIDLMKYAETNLPNDYYERSVLSSEDSLGLIWLTKLKIMSVLFMIMFFCSCQKKSINNVNREITDYYNGIVVNNNKKPLNNVTVTAYSIENDVNEKRNVILSTKTNNIGYFEIKDKTIDIQSVQSETKGLIFKKRGYVIDTVPTRIATPNCTTKYDFFDGYFFIFKIPDTLVLLEHKEKF